MVIPSMILGLLLATTTAPLPLQDAPLPPQLELKRDERGPFFEYRMKPGDNLYDNVVRPFCKPQTGNNFLPLIDIIMERSNFHDPAKIRIGACVRIPPDLLKDTFRPQPSAQPQREAAKASRSLGPDPVNQLYQKLQDRTRDLLARDKNTKFRWEHLSRLFPIKDFPSARWDYETFRRDMERSLLESDPRVNAVAFYQSRDADDLIGLENESESFAFIGLEWLILGNGWWENRLKAKDIEHQEAVAATSRQSKERAAFHPVIYNEVLYTFNREHIRRLDEIIRYLDDFIQLSRSLYHYRLVAWEDLLELGRKRAKYQTLMDSYRRYNNAYLCTDRPWPLEIEAAELPVVDLLLDDLQTAFDADRLPTDLIALNLEQSQKRRAWLRDLRLRLFVRQEYRRDDDETERPIVFGFSARAPLRWTRRSREARREATLELDALKLWDNKQQAMREVLNEYFEYRYHLTDYHTLALREARLTERLRKSKLRHDLNTPDFHPLDLIQQTLEREELHFEWLDKKRLLYQSLVQIYRWSNPIDMVPHLTPVESSVLTRYHGRRGVYIWSKTMLKRSPEFIAGYLEKNEIDKAYLSYSRKVGAQRLNQFRDALNQRGISVYWLIGDNSLLFDEHHPLDYPMDGVAGLHIDVEPHALDSWKDKREALTQAYLQLIHRFAAKTKDQKRLEIAIPVHYSTQILETIAPLADEVTIMAYGGANNATLARRLAQEREILAGKWRFAVSCKDFRDRFDMEHYMVTTDGEFQINQFAIHDLAGLIELDNREPGAEARINP